MLTSGFDHVAVLTADTDAFVEFFEDVFEARVLGRPEMPPGMRLTLLKVGPDAEFNVFQIDGNDEAARQTPMGGRGRLDHFGLRAPSLENFTTVRERLIARGATDGFVTDFGPVLSCFFIGPDGLECEVCVENPDWDSAGFHPPGTPARRFHPEAA
ncbi:VOC family protein [Sporichthya polymorpha]|uniref:VOC family protein n=1 Tax=Sporichthya polymorpha TaxID=35751 RepID=UPI00035F66E0|nr:VOC family protein [Sporichthya polymorpha]